MLTRWPALGPPGCPRQRLCPQGLPSFEPLQTEHRAPFRPCERDTWLPLVLSPPSGRSSGNFAGLVQSDRPGIRQQQTTLQTGRSRCSRSVAERAFLRTMGQEGKRRHGRFEGPASRFDRLRHLPALVGEATIHTHRKQLGSMPGNERRPSGLIMILQLTKSCCALSHQHSNAT